MTTAAWAYVALGLSTGILSGLIGLGGGFVIVPALVLLFGMSQPQAQGTTLALMVPPIGVLAAWVYYRQGLVDLRAAAFICLGFLVGGYIGARVAIGVPGPVLRKIFGGTLLLVSLRMILWP